GAVGAGRDLRLGRSVAVKLLGAHLATDRGVRERFEAEARAAAGLNHPNVVAVYDSGEDEGVPFLVMELLPGRTLADELADGPLDPERARSVGVEVLAALAASHAAGILHRDIKPGNVLLAADGTAKVGDFGIAKSTEGLDLTSAGTIVGTAAYLAPERLAGQPATAQADLYALGVVLYEALCGRKPFAGDTPVGLLRAIDAHDPIPLGEIRPGLDPSLVAIVERAMAKDPGQRFARADEMAAALAGRAAAGGAQAVTVPLVVGPPTTVLVPSTPPADPPRVAAPGPRRGRMAVAAGVLAAMLVIAILLATRSDSPSTTRLTTVSTAPPATAPGPTLTTVPSRPQTRPTTVTTENPPKPDKNDKGDKDD
ncbi:MAG TPA: serine/threonine-protein kinase, partial [Acidimicrobiales bacterium]